MKVDKDGCAVDLDLDGIINSEDRCPSIAGFEHTKGCPDMDNDSIADMDDPCPEIAGPLNGCPDSDGDQVADKDDKCPNTPGLVTLSGCPEEVVEAEARRMGIFEYNKLPMENAALVVLDENGNPVDTIYTDGEGRFKFTQLMADNNYSLRPIDLEGDPSNVDIYLTDDDGNRRDTRNTGDDTFVFTPADGKAAKDKELAKKEVEKKEQQKAEEKNIPQELLTDINFESESFTIKIKYYDQLNRLAAVLREQTNVNIELLGYADSTGPEDYNQRLTNQRADRVKRYLVKKGIPASRIKEVGKGEQNPIATNLSLEGRAENRRVEIKLID
jgi:outer membrane protein OmpA-like peptidoglycan-associated protein